MELFKAFPSVKCTPSTSGCAETDTVFKPQRVFVGGKSEKAERLTDEAMEHAWERGYRTRRTGPRTFVLDRPVRVTHYNVGSVSF